MAVGCAVKAVHNTAEEEAESETQGRNNELPQAPPIRVLHQSVRSPFLEFTASQKSIIVGGASIQNMSLGWAVMADPNPTRSLKGAPIHR